MEQNELYPIFLKPHQLKILIVGGGYVALEKLHFLLKSSPGARVKIVSPEFYPEIKWRSEKHPVELVKRHYQSSDIKGCYLVIAATNISEVNRKVYSDCRKKNILVNTADTPELCDFYLGGIVTKGHVKIAISTNGKSPGMAKRLREFFEDVLPNDLHFTVEKLNQVRKKIKTGLAQKTKTIQALTETFLHS